MIATVYWPLTNEYNPKYLTVIMDKTMTRKSLTTTLAKLSNILGVAAALTFGGQAFAYEQTGDDKDCETQSRFVFSWPIDESCNSEPRGGTSRGAPVTLDEKIHDGWQQLQEPGLSKKERDRRAILAMAGPYKVDFDFLEVVGYSEDFTRDNPYQSWGTEYVYVVEDKANFISLQHIMVMKFVDDEGNISEPLVMKHWRQDWRYQAKEMLVFSHDNLWQMEKVPSAERQGTWVQSVYQVDDSPRYSSYGTWQHNASFSTWISQTTRRPLPRREHSIRDDYDVLEGFNRHTITRTGWVQEEENWKLVLDENGKPDATNPYLSKELGVARYQRIVGHDFGPGDDYMATAGLFWADVRAVWQDIFEQNQGFNLIRPEGQPPLFVPLFTYAAEVDDADQYDSAKGKQFARETIKAYSN